MSETLGDELASRGLYRMSQVIKLLKIDHHAYLEFVKGGAIKRVPIEWKGQTRYGVPHDQVDGMEAYYSGGGLKLRRIEHPFGA